MLPLQPRRRLQAQLSSMKREFCRREALQQSRYETVVTRLAQEVRAAQSGRATGNRCTPFRYYGHLVYADEKRVFSDGDWSLFEGFKVHGPAACFIVNLACEDAEPTHWDVTQKSSLDLTPPTCRLEWSSSLEKPAVTEDLRPLFPPCVWSPPPSPSTATRKNRKQTCT